MRVEVGAGGFEKSDQSMASRRAISGNNDTDSTEMATTVAIKLLRLTLERDRGDEDVRWNPARVSRGFCVVPVAIEFCVGRGDGIRPELRYYSRRGGGIGRRAGLRILRAKSLGHSIKYHPFNTLTPLS